MNSAATLEELRRSLRDRLAIGPRASSVSLYCRVLRK
jgi:hypothetical protein